MKVITSDTDLTQMTPEQKDSLEDRLFEARTVWKDLELCLDEDLEYQPIQVFHPEEDSNNPIEGVEESRVVSTISHSTWSGARDTRELRLTKVWNSEALEQPRVIDRIVDGLPKPIRDGMPVRNLLVLASLAWLRKLAKPMPKIYSSNPNITFLPKDPWELARYVAKMKFKSEKSERQFYCWAMWPKEPWE